MEQITEVKPSSLNLEENPMDMEPFQLEMRELEDPQRYEESSRKLHAITAAINEEMKRSRMSASKMFKKIGEEQGLNKILNLGKHVGEYLRSQADRSTMQSSTRFLKTALMTIDEYKKQLPIHIRSFESSYMRLTDLKMQCVNRFKEIQKELKAKNAELEKLRAAIANEKVFEKKEELKISEQKLVMYNQNLDMKLRKYESDLRNADITIELYKTLKEQYELLLMQVSDMVTALRKHLANLEVVNPAVTTVQNAVQMIDQFSQGVEEQRRKDNEVLRLLSAALKPINGTVKDIDNPWFNKETLRIQKKNTKEAYDDYKNEFGPKNIKSLEDYKIENSLGRGKDDA